MQDNIIPRKSIIIIIRYHWHALSDAGEQVSWAEHQHKKNDTISTKALPSECN
jgi:hypothetical protein